MYQLNAVHEGAIKVLSTYVNTGTCHIYIIYISVGPLTGVLNSPVQLWLSVLSMKPSWQVQKYHPRVLMQLWSHPLALLVHSSISAISQKCAGYTISGVRVGVPMYIAITIIVAPVSQFAPVHPEVQLHVLGFTHSPPFRHPPVHMAGRRYRVGMEWKQSKLIH